MSKAPSTRDKLQSFAEVHATFFDYSSVDYSSRLCLKTKVKLKCLQHEQVFVQQVA